MAKRFMTGGSLRVLLLLGFRVLIVLLWVGDSGVEAQAITDPSDASAFQSLSQRWTISSSASWNLTEPCSGTAVDSSSIDDATHKTAIKCDCTANNDTTCRISKLKVTETIHGSIPDSLWSLNALVYLNLSKNYLWGTLSASIGNLTSMQDLNLGINALSGPIPKELGKLTDLRSLSLSSNNFSSSLPSDLGNLVKLEKLYVDSAGVSGPIPPTFSNLQNLQIVWASDNQLTGKIPDFIGNWTKLGTLRLQGNAFEGPIPSVLSKLTLITDLRISEISNGSSSLSFIRNMKSLVILVLRNNMISGTFPADIWDYKNLSHLDLSFNNLSGQIPDSLFNMGSLSNLFLGNNLLSGSIPPRKSVTLLNIDLSYNNLSGTFPSWLNQKNLLTNLVGNSFVLNGSSSSFLPSGLECLQKTFPCNRDPPIYSSFAVKCGGPEITSSNRIKFERDNASLNASSYFVAETKSWAVSSNGLFISSDNPQYIQNSQSQFANTLDSELFQTARLSPGSLRYYGLGLENGNYKVNLQFAEVAFRDSPPWQSVGRRVFDIYVQGKLETKDFDIRKQAGGVSLRAVSLDFMANVSENFLEIHLFWAGKGTCCIPDLETYGPSISAISVTPNFQPTIRNQTQDSPRRKNVISLILWIASSVSTIGVASFLAVLFLNYRKKKALRTAAHEEIKAMGRGLNTFSFSELKSATSDFNLANKLGEGGFGPVYKGTLADGRLVAVKQLSASSQQGKSQFLTEIAAISSVQHRNLVKLHGCCLEGEKRLLVYEYLENKSLDQALFGKNRLSLGWPTRYDICVGTAQGLAYLHEESRMRIVHRDVKASNILLDANLNPKISDFGLAKLYDEKKTHISTRVAGTIGYLAPEYAMRGHLTEKADVFAFGVVALEILSGRPNHDPGLDREKVYLLEWAWHLHESNCELQLVDKSLAEFDEREALRVIGIALLCTQASPALRPSMSYVVSMLSGDIEVKPVMSRPGYLADWSSNDVSCSMSNVNPTSPSYSGSNSVSSLIR